MVSEWTKLRSLRSTWWTLALAVLLGVGLAVTVAASLRADNLVAEELGADDLALVLGATGLTALVLGVLGALQMSGEYASGTISVSLTAVPRRWPLLAAKATVLTAVVAPVSLTISVGALLLGDAIVTDGLTYSWPAVLGNTLYLTAVAVLGLGLATMLRGTPTSVTVLVALVFVLPPLLPALPWGWADSVAAYLPGAAGESLISTIPGTGALGDLTAIRTLVAWSLVPLAAGASLLTRRDA
nr:ABC transporter permease subunit [uncultured Actinotalea sp.]